MVRGGDLIHSAQFVEGIIATTMDEIQKGIVRLALEGEIRWHRGLPQHLANAQPAHGRIRESLAERRHIAGLHRTNSASTEKDPR